MLVLKLIHQPLLSLPIINAFFNRCAAVSKVGNAHHSARLNVHGLPHVKPMEKAQVVAGETFQITCPVAGYPIDAVVWEKGMIASRIHVNAIEAHTFLEDSSLKYLSFVFYRQSCAANQPKTSSFP